MSELADCVPKATGIILAATAAADPLDEPPDVWSRLSGLAVRTGPPQANGIVTVFPITTAPACFVIVTQAASTRGRHPAKIGLPYELGISAVSITSLTPIGIPCSAPSGSRLSRAGAQAPHHDR